MDRRRVDDVGSHHVHMGEVNVFSVHLRGTNVNLIFQKIDVVDHEYSRICSTVNGKKVESANLKDILEYFAILYHLSG